jgi:hypothetical protein
MGKCESNGCPVSSFNWCAFQQWIRTAALVTLTVTAVMFVRGAGDRASMRERAMHRVEQDRVQDLENAPRRPQNEQQNRRGG